MAKWLAVATLLAAMCVVGACGASGTACSSGIALRGSGAVKECGYSVVRGCSVVEGRMLRLRGGEDEEEAGGEEDAADADMAGDEDVEEEEEEEEEEEGMNMNKAVKQVLYYANIHDGVVRGLKEVMQALERGDAQLVFLAEDCDEATYVELIETMCAEKGVYLLKMPEKKALGEMAGNTRLDDDGNVKKSCAASSVAIKDFGEQSEGLGFLLNYIKEQGAGAPEAPAEEEGGAAEEVADVEEEGEEE